MIQKIYEILEVTIALVALVAVIGVSTFSVLALNPNVTNSAPTQEVAGAFTNKISQRNEGVLLVNNLSTNEANYSVKFDSFTNKSYVYSADFKSSKDVTKQKFIEIFNPSEIQQRINFEVSMTGAIQEDLTIKASDETDTLVLFSPKTGVNKVSLTIEPNSKRILDISYEFKQNINFSFQVKIKLN